MVNVGSSLNNVINKDAELYLDMNNVPEYKLIERVAYVHDVVLKTSKYDSGFATFILKDVNANTVAARLFDVEDFMLSGIKATAFKHKPVKFKCTVQEFNGTLSIIIDGKTGISLWDGDFDYARFIGKVNFSLERPINSLIERFGSENLEGFMSTGTYPKEWETASLEALCNGRVGAYAKFAEIVVKSIAPLLTQENASDLLSIMSVTLEHYFEYLKKRQATDFIGTLSAFDDLNYVNNKYSESNNKLIYLDALMAVIGTEKPLHLYAHTVSAAFTYAKTVLNLRTKFEGMPLGTKTFIGGVELSKY